MKEPSQYNNLNKTKMVSKTLYFFLLLLLLVGDVYIYANENIKRILYTLVEVK